MSEVMGSKNRLVKRYANRKLYDTKESRYVTLQQIAEFVRDGEEVTIIDNTTKEDLTNVTLAQIVYEEERRGPDSNSNAGTFKSLIQSSQRLMSSLREGPVGKLFPKREESAEPPPEAGRRSWLLAPKEMWEEVQRLADDRIRALVGHAVSQLHSLNGEVSRLHDRIEELESKLLALQTKEANAQKQDSKKTGV